MRALIILLLLALSPLAAGAQEDCGACHRDAVQGVHRGLECSACHGAGGEIARPSSAAGGAPGCVSCHEGFDAMFHGPMATREVERRFVAQTYGRHDPGFFDNNCSGCHVSDCLDCHGEKGHEIARPTGEACLSCHKGYFVGWDYFGRAPREDHQRYQRGPQAQGENYLKMRPDLHAEIGLQCGECHSMASLAAGEKASKGCADCHRPDDGVIEHRIDAHRDKLECYACHSAWAAQEYGTFFLRLGDAEARRHFRLRQDPESEYVRSAYLKRQDAPPLGLNGAGRVSPVRPQFIAFQSDLREDAPEAGENRLLAARWKAFFPHTVRSGTVMCEGCHEDGRRFLLEKEEDRIYGLRRDGLDLDSFWSQKGQQVEGGGFLSAERFATMRERGEAYSRAYVEKWKRLIDRVADSSRD
ncbi:MAG: cytochrome C [Desulfuromonas sp.]|uniref:selenite/tellurite reduction operon b-type cytochrome iron-sulfur cluster-binding subunit ExtO n=1 Tax=Desulfuromonas sp. TaxID=892 RepID=UPI000CC5C29A|nr:selenite/tellurite reduction operon b-type cytochrome iron-sulfur cluster-binding subunit ExtO [Desulfuromonas sp.]PLX81744.1 MAG: cytochrome C [Desulfuromonas sp.]